MNDHVKLNSEEITLSEHRGKAEVLNTKDPIKVERAPSSMSTAQTDDGVLNSAFSDPFNQETRTEDAPVVLTDLNAVYKERSVDKDEVKGFDNDLKIKLKQLENKVKENEEAYTKLEEESEKDLWKEKDKNKGLRGLLQQKEQELEGLRKGYQDLRKEYEEKFLQKDQEVEQVKNELEQEVKKYRDECIISRKKFKEEKMKNDELSSLLDQKEQEIKKLKNKSEKELLQNNEKVAPNNGRIEELERILRQKEKENCEFMHDLQNQDTKIRQLMSQLQQEKNKVVIYEDNQKKLVLYQNELREKNSRIHELGVELNQKDRLLREKDEELQRGQERLVQMEAAKRELQERYQQKLIRFESLFSSAGNRVRLELGLRYLRCFCFDLNRLYP